MAAPFRRALPDVLARPRRERNPRCARWLYLMSYEQPRRGLPNSWLNEQATAYMPKGDDVHSRVVFDHPGLRVTAASPERMLAMKVRAARVTDIPDLQLLVDILGYTTPEQVEETAMSVFGNEPLPQRSKSTIATLFT